MIRLDKSPREVSTEIISAAKDERQLWIDDVSKNVRRLAGFTEEDVDSLAASSSEVNASDGPEPAQKRYATSFNLTRGYFQRVLGRLMPAITSFQVMATSNETRVRVEGFSNTMASRLPARGAFPAGRRPAL